MSPYGSHYVLHRSAQLFKGGTRSILRSPVYIGEDSSLPTLQAVLCKTMEVGGKPRCKIKAPLGVGRERLHVKFIVTSWRLCKTSAEEAICIPLSIRYALKFICFSALVIVSWPHCQEFCRSSAVNEMCLFFSLVRAVLIPQI